MPEHIEAARPAVTPFWGERVTRPRRQQRAYNAVTILSLCAVAIIAAGYLIPLLIRSTYDFPLNYNEGFMLYHGAEVAAGRGLYAARPVYTIENYPPLSFYLINAMAGFTGGPLFGGRILGVISLFLTAVFSGWIVFAITRDRAPAALACLLLLVSIARYAPGYVGADDPQFIANAILLAGVLLYVLKPVQRTTAMSAVVTGTALFMKHSALAFPAAIAVVLAMKERRRFIVWASALLGTALMWAAFCFLWHGPYFLEHLLSPRMFSNVRAPMSFMIVVNAMQLPLVATLLWLLIDRSSQHKSLIAAGLGFAAAYGLYVSRGDGAWVNHWFDLVIIVSIGASVAWARAETFWIRAGWRRAWVLGLFPLMVILGDAAQEVLPRSLMSLQDSRVAWAAAQSRFHADVEYERAHPGPAICENLSLCYFAGKPLDYEPFNARQRILRYPASAEAIVHALQRHQYTTVQLDASPGESLPAAGRALFPAQFMQALLANYHIDRRNDDRVFFVPNG